MSTALRERELQETVDAELRRTRNIALEDAARAVEHAAMPPGEGPLMLLDVRAVMAKAIRRLVR